MAAPTAKVIDAKWCQISGTAEEVHELLKRLAADPATVLDLKFARLTLVKNEKKNADEGVGATK